MVERGVTGCGREAIFGWRGKEARRGGKAEEREEGRQRGDFFGWGVGISCALDRPRRRRSHQVWSTFSLFILSLFFSMLFVTWCWSNAVDGGVDDAGDAALLAAVLAAAGAAATRDGVAAGSDVAGGSVVDDVEATLAAT